MVERDYILRSLARCSSAKNPSEAAVHLRQLAGRYAVTTEGYTIGVDIGVRNLAICVTRNRTICLWKTIDVFERCALVRKPNAVLLAILILRILDTELAPFVDQPGTLVTVEQQPKNRVRACANAAIAEQIVVHFHSRARVRMVRPACTRSTQRNAIPQSRKRARYRENKRIVVTDALPLLADFSFSPATDRSPVQFLAGCAKQDDYADSFLLAIA